MKRKHGLLYAGIICFFFIYAICLIVFCSGCSRIRIPGADHISSIEIEVCYEERACISAKGKTLDDLADNLSINYQKYQELK